MTLSEQFDYEDAEFPVREGLRLVHNETWNLTANAGNWWTGEQRVAIVAETRNALTCQLCEDRKNALSPYSVVGEHTHLGELPETVVEIIHRIRTDPSRLTEQWHKSILEQGITDAEYVEIVGVLIRSVAVDTFARAIGVPERPLPDPIAGEPSGYRPKGAKLGLAWVPTLAPEDANEEEKKMYPGGWKAPNIRRAMSLVPSEAIGFFDITDHQYLPTETMWKFSEKVRAISHVQIELVASRISILNGCFY